MEIALLILVLSVLFASLASVIVLKKNIYPALPDDPYIADGPYAVEMQANKGQPFIRFLPNGVEPSGLIVFHPGGSIDPRAYYWAMRSFASHGFETALLLEPLHVAMLAPNRARKAIQALGGSGIPRKIIIGGHSLGGVIAARFAAKNSVDALFLWASRLMPGTDFRSSSLPILYLYSELDGLVTCQKRETCLSWLPEHAAVREIMGGNHAQYGNYGAQKGDNPATISAGEQQRQAFAVTLEFLKLVVDPSSTKESMESVPLVKTI